MEGNFINVHNLKKHFLTIILIILVFAGLASKIDRGLNLAFNSDHVQQAVYFWDIIENNNYFLRGWQLSINPYLFTEFPLYFVLGLFFGINLLTIKISAILIFITGIFLLSFILYKTYGGKVALFNAAFLTGSSLVYSCVFLQPYLHIGTINFSLISLLIIISIIKGNTGAAGETRRNFNKEAIYYILLFIVPALSVFSDVHYIFMFIIPMIFSLTALNFMNMQLVSKGKIIIQILLLTAGTAVGLILQQAVSIFGLNIIKHVPAGLASFEKIKQNLYLYIQCVTELFNLDFFKSDTSGDNFIALSNLFIFIIVIISALFIFKREKNPLKKFMMFYLISIWILLSAAFIFSSTPNALDHVRYLSPLTYVLAFFLSILIAGNYNVISRKLKIFVIILFLVSSVHNMYKDFQFKSYQPNLQLSNFLELNNLHHGYSSYWHSNIITFLSQNTLKVRAVQYNGNVITPFLYLSNSDWYKPSAYFGPTFLIVPKRSDDAEFGLLELKQKRIKKLFGKPQMILPFENMDIYIWPYNIMEVVNKKRAMSVDITEKTPHQIGTVESFPDGNIMHASKGQSGFLIFGSYWPLKEGRYRVKFKLMAKGGINQEAARIDVNVLNASTNKQALKPIEQKILSERKSEWKKYAIDFNAEMNDDNNLLYEFRVFATGKGDVKVKEIVLNSH